MIDPRPIIEELDRIHRQSWWERFWDFVIEAWGAVLWAKPLIWLASVGLAIWIGYWLAQ